MLLPVLMLIFVTWLVLMALDAGRPKVVRIALVDKWVSSHGLTLLGYFETYCLGQTQGYLANSEVKRRWGEPVMKTEVDTNTDFPYLLPLQGYTEW